MNGNQKKISLNQIEGYSDSRNATLAERLDSMDKDNFLYKFIQEEEVPIWQITHSLNFLYPNVKIIDSEGNIIVAEINYITNNYLEINLSIPTSGTAYISK